MRSLLGAAALALLVGLAVPAAAQLPQVGGYKDAAGTPQLGIGVGTYGLDSVTNLRCIVGMTNTCQLPVTGSGGGGGGAVTVSSITTGGATPYHFISTAATNSTLVSTGAHTLYSLTLTGLNATAGYVRIYDSASAPTCSSATGAVHTYLVIGSATAQGGLIVPLPSQGELYANGLAFCVTGGSADTDNTSGPAGVLINATYK